MSSNWIQLIGLLLVSQIVLDNAIDPAYNLDHPISLDQLETDHFKCEHGKSLLINQGFTSDEFSQIQIQITSPDNGECKLLFKGQNGQYVQIILNDVQFMTSDHFNKSSQCGNLELKETNKSEKRTFCLFTPVIRNRPDSDTNHQIVNQTERVYSSNSNNLTLIINSFNNLDKFSDLYTRRLSVSYRFIKPDIEKSLLDFRKKSVCDHLFKQCKAPVQCTPLLQSTAESNFTCKYLISQQNQSTSNRIVVSQFYANNQVSFTSNILPTTNCPNSIEFFDGQIEKNEKLIIKFCLPIHQMPVVRSISNEMLVVYKFNQSNNEESFIAQTENRRTRSVRFIERNRKSVVDNNESCNIFYNATTTSQRSGQILFRNQLQDQAKDSPCFIHLISSNNFDRIWFYFLNYRPASLLNNNVPSNQFLSSADSCKITELKLFDSVDDLPYSSDDFNSLSNKGKLFCGQTQPKICNPNRQQCFLPSESYLSTGPKLSLMAMNKINPSLYLLPLQFTLNYEFINTQEYGEPVQNTICDRLFDSSRFKHGTVRSTRNLFLFGRGGRQNLNCAYIFRGQPGQRLRIQLYRIKVKSTDCTQQREPNSGANKCIRSSSSNKLNGPSSKFSVWDVHADVNNSSENSYNNDNQIRIPVDCFCNKTVNFLTPISFHLIGGQATLNFTIENMRSTEDFNDYAFEAFYEFLSTSNELFQHTPPFVQLEQTRTVQVKTNPPRNYSLTTYSLTVPSNYSFDYYQEFKQRKRLIAKQSENVLINVPNGFLWKNSALRTCSQLSRLIVYWISSSSNSIDNNHAIATICIEAQEAYREQNGLDNDSKSNNKLNILNPDQMQLSFELGNQPNPTNYQNNYPNKQSPNARKLHFYANHTIDKIDLVIELIATSKGQFRFDWLQEVNNLNTVTKFHSSMRTSEPSNQQKVNDKLNSDKSNDKSGNKLNNDTQQCIAFCPEDGLCLKQDSLCDQISNCITSTWDESPLVCEAKEQNRLEHFLSIIQTEQTTNKIDKITLNDGLFKNNWFILFSSLAFLFIFFLVAYLIVYLRKRSKHHQSMTSGNFPSAHLQIGGCNSLHTGTLQTGSASSTFSGNSSLTNSSCTNSMLCEKRLKKLRQKISNKEQSKPKHHLQTANALSLMRSSLEDNNFNPLIPTFGNNSTTILQQQPADYVSTSEFQFELNQDRLNNYDRDCLDKPSDFSPLYKKIDPDEYSLKQQHIYYQPSYTTLQRNNRLDNSLIIAEQQKFLEQQRIDSRLETNKPPLPPLPSSLLSYHSNGNSYQQEAFGLRSHTNQQLNNHHTIARQSLLESNQAERLLMSTPIYEVADRQQFNNSVQSMHRSALLRAANRRFS